MHRWALVKICRTVFVLVLTWCSIVIEGIDRSQAAWVVLLWRMNHNWIVLTQGVEEYRKSEGDGWMGQPSPSLFRHSKAELPTSEADVRSRMLLLWLLHGSCQK